MSGSRLGFQWSIPLGRTQLSIDPLVPVIMALLGWLFADQYYPAMINAMNSYYWWAGGSTAVGLFVSILVHELGHAWMAVRRGQEVPRIHIFAFGGMAVLKNRKLSPIDEVCIAIAGPIMSFGLAVLLWSVSLLPIWNTFIILGIQVLALLNAMIAGFNIIPIYPLDGGRLLRASIALGKRNSFEASILTYRIGSIIIAGLFVTAIVLYVVQSYLMSVGLGTAGFYLSYMALNGKYHLIQIPSLNSLYVALDKTKSSLAWVETIFESDLLNIEETLIPLKVLQDEDVRVINGREYLEWANVEDGQNSIEEFLKPLRSGRFIDIHDLSSYQQGVQYEAKYIPLLNNLEVIGICNAEKMRYWLNRKMNSTEPEQLIKRLKA